MSSRRDVIYWDSSIFLAWIKDETEVWREDFNGIIDCVSKVEGNVIVLATAAEVTQLEVLTDRMTIEEKERFQSLMKRRNVQYLPYHPRITDYAKEIREHYIRQHDKDGLGIIKTPDA